ncbi:hypothetical protein QVD17_39137 [Tagetes erecta]|uniref:Uncharacterized protein n=1 Tax=Tagetes erecta TaxID=13708 RepID=A0AAD8NGV0_TARER|nr:hypothetical protein QVD17_39137 [Tagetes erecta]
MDNESGSRLFGFIGAGATFGQLFGSLFATTMSWLGSYLFLIASLLMELTARSSERINKDMSHSSEEVSHHRRTEINKKPIHKEPSQRTASSTASVTKPRFWALLEGIRLICASSYLLQVSLFLWLSAMTNSFFYFQVKYKECLVNKYGKEQCKHPKSVDKDLWIQASGGIKKGKVYGLSNVSDSYTHGRQNPEV